MTQNLGNKYKSEASTEWSAQAGNFTTNSMVKIEFSLPDFIVTKVVIWKRHVDNSTEGFHNMIIVRYLLTKLGIDNNNLQIPYSVVKDHTTDV